MNCTDIQKLLSDYSMGLLHGKRLSDVESHLSACPSCKAELQKLERVALLVEGLDMMEPPVGLWNGVYNRINSDSPVEEKASFRDSLRILLRRNVARLSVGFATAALALVLAVSHMHAPVPGDNSAVGEYVEGHVIYASQEFLADDAALHSVAALADREQVTTEQI